MPYLDRSALRRTSHDEFHDLICVGFGPASLAIAVALHDMFSTTNPTLVPGLSQSPPKVAFFERQSSFAWHAGMLVPGATMQISFIKDLATLRNPKSDFTFLNYLHRQKRLIHFSNQATFLPLRGEYEDYLRWCADWFADVVEYDQDVLDVTPVQPSPSSSSSGGAANKITSFLVRSRNGITGAITKCRARHVVIAVGGRPTLPKSLRDHPRIFHSSQYARVIPSLLKNIRNDTSSEQLQCAPENSHVFNSPQEPLQIAVIGNGQSAAEIFNDLHSRCPEVKTLMLIKGAALRPSDDSPFVNEIFNPEHVDELYVQPPEVRMAAIAQNKSTNYGVVRLELLEKIYGTIYEQRIKTNEESKWQHRILPFRHVTDFDELPEPEQRGGGGRIRLQIRNDSFGFGYESEKSTMGSLNVNAVFAATGYTRTAHKDLLRPAEYLRTGEEWQVSRNYRVQFEKGKVSGDSGVWLQGCNEMTHGLSDSLLSILATRAGEVVESIFGSSLSSASEKLHGVDDVVAADGVCGGIVVGPKTEDSGRIEKNQHHATVNGFHGAGLDSKTASALRKKPDATDATVNGFHGADLHPKTTSALRRKKSDATTNYCAAGKEETVDSPTLGKVQGVNGHLNRVS